MSLYRADPCCCRHRTSTIQVYHLFMTVEAQALASTVTMSNDDASPIESDHVVIDRPC